MHLTPIMMSICLLWASNASASGEPTTVYIVSPQDGAVVNNPVNVIFGLRNNVGVAPAGVVKENTGHHHLLIDTDAPDLTQPIPKDEQHRHFGGGQTEVELTLAPGAHSLQLLLGDFAHIPHSPAIMSERINITIE
jgi:hypothetical protein